MAPLRTKSGHNVRLLVFLAAQATGQIAGTVSFSSIFSSPAEITSGVTRAQAACATIATTSANRTFFPADAGYESLRTGNWVKNAQLNPTCIVSISSVAQLSQAVQSIRSTGAQFAVRSGGHEVEAGFASIDDGVLLDLAQLNDLIIHPESDTVVVGTGNRWPTVYEALGKLNLTIVGGRAGPPGVGGFTLGGGLSYLSNKHGLACDNVINFEVVLANGNIVNANSTANVDLYTALKGGLSNFGLVSRFTLRTYSQGLVWGGSATYELEKAPQLLNALLQYQKGGAADTDSNCMVQIVPTNTTEGGLETSVSYFYAQPVERPAVFAPFYNITAKSEVTAIQSYASLVGTSGVAAVVDIVPRWNWRSTAFRIDESLYQEALQHILIAGSKTANITAGTLAVSFQPIHPNLIRQGKMKGGNALGLEETSQLWLGPATGWFFPEDDMRARNVIRSSVAAIEASAKSKGLYLPYQFANDASSDQDVLGHYNNEEILRVVAQKYDPEQFFQTQLPGGFKLPISR